MGDKLKRLWEIFYGQQEENEIKKQQHLEKEVALDDTIKVRINRKNKQLIQKYCNLQGVSEGQLIRYLLNSHIDDFIQSNV